MHAVGCAHGDDDEDEEAPNPLVRRNAIQCDREGSFSGCCRNDAEARNHDSVEVDRLEVFSADGVYMPAETQRDNVSVDANTDNQG
jgi:hypothetical protein